MEIEVHGQHTEVHPRWQELIDRLSAKLGTVCADVSRVHVTLVHSTHHLRGAEEVKILATLPGDTLKVQKSAADMGDAIHAAFTALEHETHKLVERRRDAHRQVKH